jgi:hypothetical protein
MKSTFLTTEQIGRLENNEWDVIPDAVYIKLYRDEMDPEAWFTLCRNLDVDNSTDYVNLLCIAKEVQKY